MGCSADGNLDRASHVFGESIAALEADEKALWKKCPFAPPLICYEIRLPSWDWTNQRRVGLKEQAQRDARNLTPRIYSFLLSRKPFVRE